MTDDGAVGATLATHVYTCHTDGCGNAGAAISVEAPDDVMAAVCGVCGQPITDIS